MSNFENIRPYAEFSHTAAQDGGIDNHINNIKNAAREQGIEEGRFEILQMLPIILACGITIWEGIKILVKKVKALYCDIITKKQAPLKKRAEEAEAALREEIKRVEMPESQESICGYSEE